MRTDITNDHSNHRNKSLEQVLINDVEIENEIPTIVAPSVDQQFRNCRYIFYKWWLMVRMILAITGEYVVVKNFIISTQNFKEFSLRFHMLEMTHMFALLVIFVGCTTVLFGMLRKHLQIIKIGTNMFSLHLLTSPIMLPVLIFSSLTKEEEKAASFGAEFLYIFYTFVPTINFTGALSVEKILQNAEDNFGVENDGTLTLDSSKAYYIQQDEESLRRINEMNKKFSKKFRLLPYILYKWWLRLVIILSVQLLCLNLIAIQYFGSYKINNFGCCFLMVILINGCADMLIFFEEKCLRRIQRALICFLLTVVGFVIHYFHQTIYGNNYVLDLGYLFGVYFHDNSFVQSFMRLFQCLIPVLCIFGAIQIQINKRRIDLTLSS